jgi:hypothetical protein
MSRIVAVILIYNHHKPIYEYVFELMTEFVDSSGYLVSIA